ncbi:MAG: O-antigen ligase family protein [Sediminibacterium sp.]
MTENLLPDMFAGIWPYQKKLLPSFFVFLASGIAAIAIQQPLLVLFPFAWILAPVVFEIVVAAPEKIFWLLLIVLPLSTELNLTPELGFDFPDEVLLVLLTGIVSVKMIHQPLWIPDALKQHPLFMWLLIYTCWILVTCIYSVEPLLSVKYLLAKTWYIIPLVILPQVLLTSQSSIQKMALCLLIPMLLVVIQTLARHSLYQFSFENVKKTLAPFFRNHVNYSSMLVCLIPIAWCVWKLTPVDHLKRKWLVYGLLIGFVGLFFAYSRGAWIALLLGFSAIWLIQKKLMGAMVLLAITAITVSTLWLVTDKKYMEFAPDHDRTVFHTDFSEHMRATVEMKDVSTAERFYRWVAGVRMFADKPVTGFGPNSFNTHYRPYTVGRFATWVSGNPEHSTVHNYFILTALEQGVPGLILFCVLYFGMLLRAQKLYHQLQSRFYRTIALTVAIVLIMIGVINSLSDMIETDKIGALFWLCLGMIILLDTKSREEKEAVANVEF